MQRAALLAPDGLLAIAGGGWGFTEAEWIDGWHARAADGFTNRANSAWPIAVSGGSGGRSGQGAQGAQGEHTPVGLPRTLDALRDWYDARGLPTLVNCVAGSELDQAIAALGHNRVENESTRQSARVDTVLAALAQRDAATGPGPGAVCTLADRPGPGWLSVYRAGTLPPVAAQVLGAGNPDIRFAAVVDDRSVFPLAIGRVALAVAPGDTGPAVWAGLTAIEVVPAARRRGLARLVLRELITWAAGRGVTDLFLEVRSDNAAAVELYRTLGFSVHHAYHYRVIESRLDGPQSAHKPESVRV